jgi:DNA-binding GntR family transcriptional regulator
MSESLSELLDSKEEIFQGKSLSGFVFNHIREDILSGKYTENEELKEIAIGKELGVSRTPVREALRQLELEGLVQIIPNKGAKVVGISIKDVKDIYEIRSMLEGLCVKKAIENINEDVILELDEILDLSDYYMQKGKFDAVLELDNQYHETIYKAANSKMLRHTLSDFHHYLERMRKTTLQDKTRVEHSNNEHRELAEAIKAKDIEKAMFLADKHIKNTMNNIENHGLW